MTRVPYTPKPYQRLMTEHALEHRRCGLYAGMGMGKTSSVLTVLDALTLVDDGPALAIAPLRVAKSTWPKEMAKWEHLAGMTISPIVGNVEERAAALRRKAAVYTINYENVPWLVDRLGDQWPFRKVVADESPRVKSFRLRQGGKRAQALARVAHKYVDRFIELSGTPSPNGLQDLWGQLWFLDKGERLGRSFDAFQQRWFRSVQVGEDRFAVKLEPLPHAQAEIQQRISDICISFDAKDWLGVKDPIVSTVEVELPPRARALYDRMEDEMFVELMTASVEAFNAGAKSMKCLQIACGALYTNEQCTAWEEIHDAKLDALESIIEEAAGMPVLVAYHWRHDLPRLLKRFPQGRVLDQKAATIDDWNAGKISPLFAHPESAGHGLNLQDGGNIVVFFGHWWALEPYLQMIERIGPTRQMQSGHDRAVFVYNIVAANTVDEAVIENRTGKREVQDTLLNYLNRRRHGTRS